MNKNLLIKELENYKYDFQYYQEKSKEIEKLKNAINKSYDRLNDMKLNKIDTTDLNKQIQQIIDKQTSEENFLLTILEKKQQIEERISSLDQPYKNIFFMKYINLNTFDEIALKMNYSTKRIYQLHKKGLAIYCELYSKKEDVPEISKS